HLRWNKRQALLLNLPRELVYLAPVQQQFPRACRLVILAIAVTVRTDVHVHEPRFRLANLSVAVLQVAAPFANRLHFGAGERDTAFVSLEDMVVVVGLSITRHHFVCRHDKDRVWAKIYPVSSHSTRSRIYLIVQHGRNADASVGCAS